MSVTINTPGSNSRQLVISGETSAANIITAVNTALTALGWTLIDTLTTGALNCMVTKVYSAPNADDPTTPTTKYMILRFDAPKGLWYVSCAEYWNATTHVATNESFNNGRSFPLGMQYNNCTIYVFASARYAAFMSVIRSEAGPWQGVFEFEREAAEDTVAGGIPCFGWTSALTIGENYSADTTAMTGPRPHVFWVPRTKNGYTGWGACQQFVFNTAFGMFPPNASSITYGSAVASPGAHFGLLGAFGNSLSYVWDAGKKLIGTLKLAGSSTAYNTGRLFGMKVVPPTGAALDTVVVPVDASGFYSSSGTNTNHFLLPVSGGDMNTLAVGNNRLVATLYSGGPSQNVYDAVVIGGRFVYCAASSYSIMKLDLDTSVWTTVYSGGGATYACQYDGAGYIYFATANGVTRLAVADDSLTHLAVTGGCLALTIDDTYLYASDRTTITTPKVEVINLSTFVVDRTVTSAYTLSTAAAFSDMDSADYNGFAYAHAATTGTNTADCRIWKMKGLDGTQSNAVMGSVVTSSVGGCCFYDGTDMVVGSWPASAAGYLVSHSPSTLTPSGLTASVGSTTVVAARNGAARAVPFKGYRCFASAAANAQGLWGGRALSGSTSNGWGIVANATVSTGLPTATAFVTDGVAVYYGSAANAFCRVGGQCPVYNNAGNQTAHILLPA